MAEVSTEVLGRKTYALMQYWETDPVDEEWTTAEREFARRWRGIHKVVASSTMTHDGIGSDRVRLVPDLSLAELQRIVDGATGVVEIFGPTVAAPAIRAGLVDEFQFVVVPKMAPCYCAICPVGETFLTRVAPILEYELPSSAAYFAESNGFDF